MNAMFLVLLFGFQDPYGSLPLVEETPPKIELLSGQYQPGDFYFRDDNKKIVALTPIGKVLVTFKAGVSDEEKERLLAGLSDKSEKIEALKSEINLTRMRLNEVIAKWNAGDRGVSGEMTIIRQKLTQLEKQIVAMIEIQSIDRFTFGLILNLVTKPPYDKNPGAKALELINKHLKDSPDMILRPIVLVDGREAIFNDVLVVIKPNQ